MKRPAMSRPMDVSFPSNRFILIATPAIGTIAGLVGLISGETLLDSAGWGISTGGAGFLAWAIGRELHPDRAWVATVATVVAPWGVLIARPDLISAAVVMLVARALADTTGRAFRPSDVILFGIVGGIAVFRDPAPGVLAVGAIGLTLVALWSDRGRTWSAVTVALYVAGASAAAFVADAVTPSDEGWVVLAAGTVVGLITLTGPGSVAVGTDRAGGTIRSDRVRVARLLTFLMAAAATPTADPAVMFPVFAALAATAIHPR
jgi:hypothetical protein